MKLRNTIRLDSQRGAALAVGLIFLLVLTILGVSSLSTTSLEEKMAGNLQEKSRAFQTAEAAVVRFVQTQTLSAADDCSSLVSFTDIDVSNNTDADICSDYLGNTPAGRTTDTAFGGQTSFNHFNINSEGHTPANARAAVNQGVYQLGPGSPGVLIE